MTRPPPSALLRTEKQAFYDYSNRTIILRGANLACKQPLGQPSHDATFHLDLPSSPSTAGRISFVGSPLKLKGVQVHIERLKSWGFRAVRLAICWEALEHEGPGKYDEEYIDYVIELLHAFKAASFRVFIDPHQDCWSRSSGGSGAPYWTLLACGLNPRGFQATQAALAHGSWNGMDGKTEGEEWPDMIWQTNSFKLACLTMFALFYGGRTFAPRCIIDGVNIQDWLHEKYLGAFGRLADRIAEDGTLNDICVIGWDSMNEPQDGFIGIENLDEILEKQSFKTGPTPSPFEALKLGMGQKQKLRKFKFGSTGSKTDGHVTVDPEGTTCWLAPGAEPGGVSEWGWKRDPGWTLGVCVWALHRVWDIEKGTLLRPDYFLKNPKDKSEIQFLDDFWIPHWKVWNARIRKSHPLAIAFINPPVFEVPPDLEEKDQDGRVCLSPHYYDGMTLINKRLHSFNADAVGLARKTTGVLSGANLGLGNIRESVRHQLGQLTIKDTKPEDGFSTSRKLSYPAVLGEVGVPFDFRKTDKLFGLIARGGSQKRYRTQEKALDMSLTGCDGKNAVGSFVWAYECHNTKELGDGWNGEDLSIFCEDDYRAENPSMETPQYMYDLLNTGARAQRAFSRPYPLALIGRLKHLDFSMDKSEVTFAIEEEEEEKEKQESEGVLAGTNSEVWTEVYLPYLHFVPLQLDATADELSSLAPREDLSKQTIVFNPSTLLPTSPLTAHLVSAPEPNPPLGIKTWSAESRAAPRVDIKIHVLLEGGLPSRQGETLLFEAEAVGQLLRWRWVLNGQPNVRPGGSKKAKPRKYSVKIEKWGGHGLPSGLLNKISQALP